VTYVPIPRFFVIIRTGYYAHYQFQKNLVLNIMDFITDLSSSNGFDSIFVVVDRRRRWPILCHVIRWSPVKKLRDSLWIIFTSTMAFLSTSSPILKVKIKLSFAYHCQTDGQIERDNQVLEKYLRCTIKTIGQSCYHLLSLRTTTPSKDLLSRLHSLPTMGIFQSLISSTSTKWKIQQLEALLLDYLRFIRR
jgi:hypothetical protein